MTRKIFVGVFLMGIVVLLICAFIFFGLQYAQTIDENRDSLRGEAHYAMAGLGMAGEDYLQALDVGESRITWIGGDGAILYDSPRSGTPSKREKAASSATPPPSAAARCSTRSAARTAASCVSPVL